MKIIDFHVHVGKFELLRDDIQELLTRRPMESNVNVAEVFSKPEILENYLTTNGINRAVLLAECGPGTNYTIDSQMIAEFAKNNDMFITFGSINPNYHNTEDEFWKSLKLGIKGFKFYPADHSFNALRDDMQFVYKMCESLGLPVMFHTGLTAQKDTEQKFIKPRDFEPLAKKYPDLVLILAHGGKPYWYEEAMTMALSFPNVYIDTALVDPLSLDQVFPDLEKLSQKIIFGSDWPVAGSYSALIDKYKQANIPESIMSAILYKNAEKILNDAFKKQEDAVSEALLAVSV
ncbi:amidohydrolase family protein [Moorena sp. SIO3I6]|uniref:amidohydrolase family protein n=1 Tax=Moorena sp. SIO3I6 TaxID=2607831 RepID=UPI0013F936F4|nr:amidohydrolase family protein [Moorena sp. SIO3I6]NEP23066.1 amidohydrolase [Moorena sp. SIO3I6]